MNNIIVYPNPTSNEIRIQFQSKIEKNYQLKISDATGRVVLWSKCKAMKGVNNQDFDMSKFSKGIYWVNIIFEDKNEMIRITVQ